MEHIPMSQYAEIAYPLQEVVFVESHNQEEGEEEGNNNTSTGRPRKRKRRAELSTFTKDTIFGIREMLHVRGLKKAVHWLLHNNQTIMQRFNIANDYLSILTSSSPTPAPTSSSSVICNQPQAHEMVVSGGNKKQSGRRKKAVVSGVQTHAPAPPQNMKDAELDICNRINACFGLDVVVRQHHQTQQHGVYGAQTQTQTRLPHSVDEEIMKWLDEQIEECFGVTGQERDHPVPVHHQNETRNQWQGPPSYHVNMMVPHNYNNNMSPPQPAPAPAPYAHYPRASPRNS